MFLNERSYAIKHGFISLTIHVIEQATIHKVQRVGGKFVITKGNWIKWNKG